MDQEFDHDYKKIVRKAQKDYARAIIVQQKAEESTEL
jgi:hypothetical protein